MALPAHPILVIEPHPILREGIVAVLAHALVGAFITGVASFPDAITFIESHPVDLVLTDFRAQGDTVLSLLKQLGTDEFHTRCLILSAGDEIQIGYPCIRAGASGFVAKTSTVADVVIAVQTVLAGRHHVSEHLSHALMAGHGPDPESSPGTHLTSRELQIFSKIGQGMAVSAIAAKLGLSVRTVEAHREHIKNKLGHQSASQVTAAAVRWLDDTSVSI
jgi:DNA-binding NarL/FixJ family response regulator